MKITLGILAHVDAGKTTLSEALLYSCGTLHRMGRVDNRDTYLDSSEQERRRGITIISKPATFRMGERFFTLIDTPGHTDFASEAEAVLPALDCAILLVSVTDGITAHTETLWRLLSRHGVPTFLFLNKTDLPGKERGTLMKELIATFGQGFVDMTDGINAEDVAVCSEALMERYLTDGVLSEDAMVQAVRDRRLFPCYFGSALRMTGIDRLLDGMERFMPSCTGDADGPMGGRIFQIGYDEKGSRITRLKLTSGRLRARAPLTLRGKDGKEQIEKPDRITRLSGRSEAVIEEGEAGDVLSLSGLNSTYVGQGIGIEEDAADAVLRPVTSYRLVLPSGCSAFEWLPRLKRLEEENPQLALRWVERTGEIRISLTGQVQTEVLTEEIARRFGIAVRFDGGSILYRETVTKTVEGVGHFEPLRHYAEVHLLIEPLERGKGLQIASSCPPDRLAGNWQRGILEYLRNETLTGVLTNSPLTDLRITLISGKAHPKHTEAGDFIQATSRALRQGLMQAECILLEPHYDFLLTLPAESLGRAMTDLDSMGGTCLPPAEEGGIFLLRGHAPVRLMQEYLPKIPAYTAGRGRISVKTGDYLPCTEGDAVIAAIGYHAEADPDHPADSIFCKNGAGYAVSWQTAEAHMHLPTRRRARAEEQQERVRRDKTERDFGAEDRELMAIFERTYGPIRRRRLSEPKRVIAEASGECSATAEPAKEYLLVDAYNVIFAWEELRAAAEENLDLSRSMLIHLMLNYQGYRKCPLILVFDAYRMPGGGGTVEDLGGVYVVYTRSAETADAFIERISYLLGEGRERKKRSVRVVTSDGAEQLIVLGHGATRVSAEGFREEVMQADREIAAILERMNRTTE